MRGDIPTMGPGLGCCSRQDGQRSNIEGFILMPQELDLQYKNQIIRSMQWLAEDPRTLFIGQSVKYSGNAIYNTVVEVPDERKIEMPVCEELQMGFSTGLALEGYVPVTCYPRFDFLILACNQLVNHLDKIDLISKGDFKPRVIIRTSVGSKNPLDAGEQHTQDHTLAFKSLLKKVHVVMLDESDEILPAYQHALQREPLDKFDSLATLLIEHGDHYNAK